MYLAIVLTISVALQTCAAYMALRMIPITRKRKAWIIIAGALCLLAIRRVVTAYCLLTSNGTVTAIPLEEIIALSGSALLVVGMAAIQPVFRAMRASEDAVRQSERRYRNLYEVAPCGFLSLDREGIIRQCNRRAEQILGYARGALLGVPLSGLLLESDGNQGPRSIVSSEQLWKGDPLSDFDVQMCTADARAVWVSLTIDPIRDTGDLITEFRAIIVDISERVAASDQLRLTQFAVDHVGETITQVGPDGRFLYVNDIAVTTLGYSREVFLTKHVWDVDPQFSEAGWPTFWDDLRNRGTLVFESEACHADKTLHPVEITISHVSLSGREFLFSFVRGIAERRRAQERLELTQYIVDHAGESIYLMDKDGRFTYVNDTACGSLKHSREELLSMTVFEIDPAFTREQWKQCWEQLSQGTPRLIESTHRDKDGKIFPVEISASKMLVGGREFDCAFVRDISERRETERSLRLSEERIRVSLKNSPIVVFNQDCELRYTWVYHEAEGTRDGGVIGLTDHDLLSPAEAEPLARFKRSVMESGIGQRGEFTLTLIKGNPRIYDLTAEPLHDAFGTIAGITCAAVDVTDVRDMQQSLRESEELHRTVVNSLDEGVMLWGREGRLLAANPSAARLLKLSIENSLADPSPAQGWKFIHPDGSPFAVEEIPSERAILTGESCTNVIVGVEQPGEELKWFSVNSRPIFHADQSEPYAAVLSFHDITAIKAIEDALRESERRFREMLSGVQLIALTLDSSGNITFCNDHLLQLTGWRREEVLGKSWFDLFVPADVRAEINPSFRRDTPLGTIPTHQEYDIKTRDGNRRLVRWSNTILRDLRGTVIGTAGLGEDITERRRAEATLQRDLIFKSAVVDISEHALSPSSNAASVARLVLERALALTGSRHGYVAEVEPVTGDVVSHTLTLMMGEDCRVAPDKQSAVFPKGPDGYSGLWGHALNTEKAFYTNSATEHPSFKGVCPEGHVPIERFLAAPAASGRKIVGQIALANPPTDYTDEQLDSIRELAAVYAMAVEHQRSGEALRHRESQLSAAQAIAHVGSWELDLATDTLVWSDEIFRIFEVDPARFGASYEKSLAAVHPDDREMIDKAYSDSLSNNTPYDVVHRLLLPDGRVKYVHERGETHYDEQGHPRRTVGTVQDITDRTRSEEQIVILKRALDAHHDGVYWMDRDNKFVYVNDAGCRVLGYEPQELLGKSIVDVNPLATPERMAMVWEKLRKDGFYTAESVHRRRDGTELPVEIMTTYVLHEGREYAAGFARDISERKRAHGELQKALSRFESVIEQTPLVAVQSLERDGTIRSWNPACEHLYGYPALEATGRPIQELVFSGQEALEFEDALHTVWDECRPSAPRELAAHTRDGSARTVYSAMFPIHEDQDVIEVIRMDVDITGRKKTEEQLLRAKRLEAAGQLAGQIAHDFNNLLGPLVAYPEMISSHFPDDPRIQEMLRDMEAAARQIADINQELLTMSRRGHYNLEPLDLNRLVEHGLRTLTPPAQVTVHRELFERLPLVRGGASQIMRLLTNLITNAFDAMPEGGTLTIRTSQVKLTAPLKRYAEIKPGEFIRLDVTDTGRGIPAGTAERIFEPFFTTKKADRKRGSGLGLAVVHSVMEDHEGYVDFESEPGEGTMFSLFFPVNAMTVQDPTPSSEVPMGRGERVLVVDDDAMQRRIAERTLKRLGYEVQTVSSGEDAVDFVAHNPQDVLLLDMVMDGIDGAETLRRIKRLYPNQIAIILSGYACSDRVEEALRLGARGFIQKPVHLVSLATALVEALGKRPSPTRTVSS